MNNKFWIILTVIVAFLETLIYQFYNNCYINYLILLTIPIFVVLIIIYIIFNIIKKNLNYIIIINISLIIFNPLFNLAIENIREQKTKSFIVTVIPLLEDYKDKKGNYPINLKTFESLKNQYSFIFFPIYKIYYLLDNNGYKIEYLQRPIGPYEGYSSANKNWYFNE